MGNTEFWGYILIAERPIEYGHVFFIVYGVYTDYRTAHKVRSWFLIEFIWLEYIDSQPISPNAAYMRR